MIADVQLADPAHLPSQGLLSAADLPRGSCEDAQAVSGHTSAEGRAAERALGQHKNRNWQQYLIDCTLCTMSKEQT